MVRLKDCGIQKSSKWIVKGISLEIYKGKMLVRGGKTTTNEGAFSPRTVIIEFPSHDEANIFYNSKEYQEAHAILKGFAIRHHQTVEGV